MINAVLVVAYNLVVTSRRVREARLLAFFIKLLSVIVIVFSLLSVQTTAMAKSVQPVFQCNLLTTGDKSQFMIAFHSEISTYKRIKFRFTEPDGSSWCRPDGSDCELTLAAGSSHVRVFPAFVNSGSIFSMSYLNARHEWVPVANPQCVIHALNTFRGISIYIK